MEFKECYRDYFKPSPLGIKLIIVLYGVSIVSDTVDLILDFSIQGVVGLCLCILFFAGFTFRWEMVRVVSRFFIGLFTVGAVYKICTSEKFRIAASDNAIWWSICWGPTIIVFFYLGTKEVKNHFKPPENVAPQAINVDASS